MKIVIVGGGIAAVHIANNLKAEDSSLDVMIVSDEQYPPYDRIHLCRLVDEEQDIQRISLLLEPSVRLELNHKITKLDPSKKQIFSASATFEYDKLIIATGSEPVTLFDIENITNAAVFRSVDDCKIIKKGMKGKEIVIVGSGPIALELLETLNEMPSVASITLLVRSKHLYYKNLSAESRQRIEESFTDTKKVKISYEDEIVDTVIEDGEIKSLQTKKQNIMNPFLVFGVGIKPNIENFRDTLECDKGILTNRYMQTSDADIYAVGECAEVEELGFIAGHVKECVDEAQCAISHLLQKDVKPFEKTVSIDMLKVGKFDLIDVKAPTFSDNDEKILITSTQDNSSNEYFIHDGKLSRFIGINSKVNIEHIELMMKSQQKIDIASLYNENMNHDRGRLVCSCEHMSYKDIVDVVVGNGVESFLDLKPFSKAGRVCGRCKNSVETIIQESQHLLDPNRMSKSADELALEEQIHKANKRIDKFNNLHPRNQLTEDNLQNALESLEIAKDEINRWVSMVTATMQLHPGFEDTVNKGVKNLNKIPIIWLELADCSGNSEAFIKSTNPAIEDLIFDYISLDYHELLMSASANQSETILEDIIKNQKGEYILIVEGAVPMAMDGKYLRIGPKGETGLELLQRCAKDAALILAVGSCAYDGGVVAAHPNPTGAVGVAEALQREDVINISGCPTNPMNIIGTLVHYIMFEELPELDEFGRPLWAYQGRIHDNCERRGHFELGEFVKEWGDEGAKKGWCLFEMGCKGSFAHANCPLMKFNGATSWPVQAGHGCMACTEKGFFDLYANERKYEN